MTDSDPPIGGQAKKPTKTVTLDGTPEPAKRIPKPARNQGPPKSETKIRIAHPSDGIDAGVEIVGLLARCKDGVNGDVSTSTRGRPLALILHGLYAHKNQTYHRTLVAALDMDSFRFDFRGNDESTGNWDIGALDADYRDLQLVIDYMRNHYGYRIELVVAHSRGAGLGWEYFAKDAGNSASTEKRIPFFASMGARWYPPGILRESCKDAPSKHRRNFALC